MSNYSDLELKDFCKVIGVEPYTNKGFSFLAGEANVSVALISKVYNNNYTAYGTTPSLDRLNSYMNRYGYKLKLGSLNNNNNNLTRDNAKLKKENSKLLRDNAMLILKITALESFIKSGLHLASVSRLECLVDYKKILDKGKLNK